MSAMFKVQKSLYDSLKANSTFTNKINNRLYDEPPANTAYPYVLMGMMSESNLNRLNKDGFRVTMELQIFTKTGRGGTKEAKEILESANNVLNLKRFSMEGFTMVQVYYINSFTEKTDDKTIVNANYEILCH